MIAGIAAIVVMLVGLFMMLGGCGFLGGFGPPGLGGFRTGGVFLPFIILWVLIGLLGAGTAFYNAFSRRGLALYEVDIEQEEEGRAFCPQCGRPVDEQDQFCRHCGAPLE